MSGITRHTTLPPNGQVSFDTETGDEASRLAQLEGRLILVVMGSYPGKRPVYEHLRALGLRMVVLDGPGHWAREDAGEGLFERFLEVDLVDDGTLFDRALDVVQRSGLVFDGVATFEEFAGPLAARLAAALGLPGHDPNVIETARDKEATRRACERAGIPTPRYFRVHSASDITEAARHVGFPAILKPVSGASSVASFKVSSEDELRARYIETMDDIEHHLKHNRINSDNEPELVWSHTHDMVVEEFLDGDEFDVDCLLCDGEVVYAAPARDHQIACKETGGEIPPLYSCDRLREIEVFAEDVLHALGFTRGVFHVEVMYTPEGPRLLEVNARMGGDPTRMMHELVWGVDLAEQYAMLAIGLSIRPRRAPHPRTAIAFSFMPAARSGYIANTDVAHGAADHPAIVEWELAVRPGQYVHGLDRGAADWTGSLIVQGDSSEHALRVLDEVASSIHVPIVPER